MPFSERFGTTLLKIYCKVALPLQQHGFCRSGNVVFPIYDPSTPVSVAWGHLISGINTAKMERADLEDMPLDKLNVQRPVTQTPTIQLLHLFPHPSRHHWFPSWCKNNDPGLVVAGGTNCSLRMSFGRIYHGCSLQLIQPSTPKKGAVYCTAKVPS